MKIPPLTTIMTIRVAMRSTGSAGPHIRPHCLLINKEVWEIMSSAVVTELLAAL